MKTKLFILIFFLFTFAQSAFTQIIFSDDFAKMPSGSNGSPNWNATKGDWVINDGKYYQRSLDYDCGSILPQFINYSFEFTFWFKISKGEVGAGFFFSSESRENTAFSQMLRFDGPTRVLMGYFENGEYAAQKTFHVDLDTSNWNQFQLIVNIEEKIYSIKINDESFGEPVLLRYFTGFTGLQSSGGETKFDNVVIKKISEKKYSSNLLWPKEFALDLQNRIWISNRFFNKIDILDEEGFMVDQVKNNIIQKIGKICVFPNESFIVTDNKINRLHLFNSANEWKKSVGGINEFSEISDLVYNSHLDRLIVLENKNHQFKIFNSNLNSIGTGGRKYLLKPVAVTFANEKLTILDAGDNKIKIFDLKKYEQLKSINLPLGIPKDLTFGQNHLFFILNRKVLKINLNGNVVSTFSGKLLNSFVPSSLEIVNENEILISDFVGNRIVKTNLDLLEPEMKHEFLGENQLKFQWDSIKPTVSNFELAEKYGPKFLKKDQVEKNSHAVIVQKIKPNTIYKVKISPSLETIPSEEVWSKAVTIKSPVPKGEKAVVRFPALCLLFSNIVIEVDSLANQMPSLSKAEIDRIKQQMLDGVLFYWVHSHFNFWVDLDFWVIDKKINKSQLVGPEWWYPPLETVIDSIVTSKGKSIKDYPGVFFLLGEQKYLLDQNRWELSGRGGGFTSGISANNQFGLSWWYVTPANHAAGNNWLMVHEFNHQVDDLFNGNGYSEYWFNHFAPKIENVAQFGEHFDGNSYLMHLIPEAWWFDQNKGEILMVEDYDQDGIPDQDKRLPLDEKRLKSSPKQLDSDRDGISDLKEVMFSNWLTEGQGETYGGNSFFPNLSSVDTDGDGLNDKDDRNPLYSMNDKIKLGTPQIDGVFQQKEWPSFFIFDDKRIRSEISVSWDSTALYFAIELDKYVPFKIQIDGNNNGWFLGADNWLLNFKPENDEYSLKKQIFDASDFINWPQMNSELAKELVVDFKVKKSGEKRIIEIAIFKNEKLGIHLEKSKLLGFNIGFYCPMDSQNHKRYITIFEPNRFMKARLE